MSASFRIFLLTRYRMKLCRELEKMRVCPDVVSDPKKSLDVDFHT
jgi:hypothetical protein